METKIKHKNCDDFADITADLRAKGLNLRWFSRKHSFPYSTVRFALAGYPKTVRAAMIRQEARNAVEKLNGEYAK